MNHETSKNSCMHLIIRVYPFTAKAECKLVFEERRVQVQLTDHWAPAVIVY